MFVSDWLRSSCTSPITCQ